MARSELTLSPDQERALNRIRAFVNDGRDGGCLVMHGLAGTGKTTVLAAVAREYPGAILGAYTGKAASVLARRVDLDVKTLHSILYYFRGLRDDEWDPDRKVPTFEAKGHRITQLVMLDEGSMLGRRVAEDVLATGAKIVVAGDPGQLPPVGDVQYFTRADVTLSEIHRQALDSPIIRQAHAVRRGERYRADGDAFRVVERASEDDVVNVDAMLCWRNRTRVMMNFKKRLYLGLEGRPPQRGEPLLCLKNNHKLGVLNGATYDLAEDVDPEDPEIHLVVDDAVMTVDLATIEGVDPGHAQNRYEEGWTPFAYGYALTVHKSQGSEWENVLFLDEYRGQEYAQLTYTAITRAAQRITVIR